MQEILNECHGQLTRNSFGGMKGHRANVQFDLPAIHIYQQSLQVGRDIVDDSQFQSLLRRSSLGIRYRRPRPFQSLLTAPPGQALNIGHQDVGHLALHGIRQCLSAHVYRRSRPNAGTRSHSCHVRGQRDERPRRSSMSATRSHVDHDGHPS